ncbi:hypothetical protein [Thiocystis violascens]|uniref:DUF3168 domain-containing protein n=1 Tax=Thiocystis violascens (strain ATCC 17096 / DSM 198 / 6111) TaxID=765911 RepID=I3YEI7_THIV6|nr:hypothetical protein [Thiocystis violascens]AFL75405.1 hypothetical protein Thivi_3538 [Thiocystis violascens DSM 198]
MRTAPFLDPELLVSALSGALVPTLAEQVLSAGHPGAAHARRARIGSPALIVCPHLSVPYGPEGLGNGRFLAETYGVLIQVRTAAPDAWIEVATTLRTLRAGLFDTLEAARLDPAWAPLRYVGGERMDVDDDPAQIYRWIEYYQTETALTLRPRTL